MTPTYSLIRQVFIDVAGIDDMEVDLLDAGVPSIVLAGIVVTLTERLGRPVSVKTLVAHPIGADLVKALDND